MNSLLQLAHVSEGAAPNAPLSDLGKETLHLIQPTGTGGSKVQVIARMPGKPALHLGRLVCPVVVYDEVHGGAGREWAIHLFQEFEKLLGTMTTLTLADDFAAGHLQGGKQRS